MRSSKVMYLLIWWSLDLEITKDSAIARSIAPPSCV